MNMNREIKYRCWEKETKKMCFVDALYQPLGAALKRADIIAPYDEKTHSVLIEDVNIMQFTGLKDKNGKEIFEGDILRDERKRPGIGCVFFEDGSFKIKWQIPDYDGMTSTQEIDKCFQYSTIIGNIYENKSPLPIRK